MAAQEVSAEVRGPLGRRKRRRRRRFGCTFVGLHAECCVGVQGSTDGPLQASALEGPASHSTGPMSNSQLAAGSALRTLIGQKEKELHDMNEYRIQVGAGHFYAVFRAWAMCVEHIFLLFALPSRTGCAYAQ